MVVLFAGTTMDSGVRLQRYIIQEWGDIYNIPLLNNGVLATLIAVTCCLLLAFGAGGASGSGGLDHLAVVRFDQPDSCRPDVAGYFSDADQDGTSGPIHAAADDIRPDYVVVGGRCSS